MCVGSGGVLCSSVLLYVCGRCVSSSDISYVVRLVLNIGEVVLMFGCVLSWYRYLKVGSMSVVFVLLVVRLNCSGCVSVVCSMFCSLCLSVLCLSCSMRLW